MAKRPASASKNADRENAEEPRLEPGVDQQPDEETGREETAPDADPYEAAITELLKELSESERALPGARLFIEACVAFGISPNPATRPVEVVPGNGNRRWRFLPGSDLDDTPDRVRFVTAGGFKLTHPMDEDTEDRMLTVLGLKGIDPATGNSIVRPLPADLTLPRTLVSGIPPKGPEKARLSFLRESAQQAARRGLSR